MPEGEEIRISENCHNMLKTFHFLSNFLWIRIGFNADPDQAFYLSVDPYPERQTNARIWILVILT
jgi:hypothetical protein